MAKAKADSAKQVAIYLRVSTTGQTTANQQRELEGIATAKAAGVYKGRIASTDPDQVRKLKTDGVGASAIAKTLNIGRASVHRVLGAAPQPLSGET
jgi:DNA invertase Pin-like site-specific DNA recombinase